MSFNSRTIIKFSVFVITVLLADLVKETILKYLPAYQSTNPFKLTAVSMALAVLVFVPVFAILDKYIKVTAVHYVKNSKVIPTKSRLSSAILGLVLALLILYSGFLYVRFGIHLHRHLLTLLP